MKTLERGYFKLKTQEVDKWMHFSRTSLTQLQEISGEDVVAFGSRLQKEELSPEEQFNLVAILCHAGLNAYDLEEGNEIDYNKHKVANWVYEAASEDDDFGYKLINAFMSSLPLGKKEKGQVSNIINSTY